MSNSETFFEYDFAPYAVVGDNPNGIQDNDSDSDCEELHHQIYFEKRKRLKPLTDKLSQWRRNIRNTVGRLRDMRGSSDESSRANSAMSFNSSNRSSQALEVIDFIDDDYLALRRRVRVYHHHLCKVFAHLNSALKRGPPLGGRLDALKSTFKTGAIDQFPEEALAKCFGDFCLDLTSDGQLAKSLRDSSDAFNASASLRQSLVKTARSGFLAPLTEFLTRDWKEICFKDKSLQQLAKKIQKSKIESKLSQVEINAMMSQFAVRREDVIGNFEYILRSEIPLTKRLINLMEAYKLYYFENTKIFNSLERSLRMYLGQPIPDKIWFDEGAREPEEGRSEFPLATTGNDSRGVDNIETEAAAPEPEPPTLKEPVPSEEAGANRVNRLGNGDGSGLTLGNLLLNAGNDGSSAKKSIWDSKNLKPIAEAKSGMFDYRSTARAYGFVRTAFSASGGDELNLAVGDLVYLDTKLEHAETKRIWICGEVSGGGGGCEKRAGLFPLDALEVIIDL